MSFVTIRELKENVPITDVLSYYGWDEALTYGSFGWVSIRCPFHDDNNPSAQYSLSEQHFDCFSCDIHGDIIDVVRWAEGFDVRRAKEFIERKFNVRRPTSPR